MPVTRRSHFALLAGVAIGLAALLLTVVHPAAQSRTADWLGYANAGGSRYSPLDQINASNVGKLQVAWRASMTPDEMRQRLGSTAPPAAMSQNTPLKVGNLVYMSTGVGAVAAVDATTGRLAWFDLVPESVPNNRRRLGNSTRGIAYWKGGRDERIFSITGDYLVALNAKTGERVRGFGQDGAVDLVATYDRKAESYSGSMPLVVRDVVVLGGLGGPSGDGYSESMLALKEGWPGDVRGYDARTGKLLWTFHTVPRKGEFGHDTWLNGSAEYTGDTNVWAPFTGDDELGYVYLPVGTPTSDYWGGYRPGNNLFAESLVCLDVRTGKRVWHYQMIHHGIWDYDVATAPVLADITVDGRKIKAVAQVTKHGFTFVFDRVTGKPVWPIEERPVPKGDAPGEWYAPTQPFPTKPPAFDRLGVTVDDLIDWTPELRKEALDIINQYRWGPLFTPPSTIDGPDGKKGTIFSPGNDATAWYAQSYDPETGVLYVTTGNSAQVIELVPSKNPQSNIPLVRKDLDHLFGPRGLPSPFKPPYSKVTAIDLNKGEILWTWVNGDGPRDHPAIKHLNLPPMGSGGRAAALITKSLMFIGEGRQGGKMFRAVDKKTGTTVWETELPALTGAAPMTYMANGKQYIVMAIGGAIRAELIAFTLP